MALPLSFLVGLLLLLLHAEFDDALPGAESTQALVGSLGVLAVPWLLAHVSTAIAARAVRDGSAATRLLRLALLAQSMAVPGCYAVLLFVGELPRFVGQLVPDLQVAQFALLFAPLLFMEASMRWAERGTIFWIEQLRLPAMPLLGPCRLPMTLFVVAPFMALAVVADLISLDRRAEVFFQQTSLGIIVGLLLLVALLCVTLPLIFRLVMPVSRQLPLDVGGDLRRTAAALGFSGDSVLSMNTGLRIVNAALVGPAPWPRFLVLTDGLLALLDPLSLRGVVAHEVGHARANHPGLLVLVFAVLPLLLFFPLSLMEIGDLDALWMFAAFGGGAVVAWLSLRGLAHRFEFEADQLSAEALGGARYCVQALRRVGELSPRTLHRSSFRHPSESRRIRHLYACEQEPAYRERFWRRGRWLRRFIGGALVAALALCLWAQLSLWPVDRAAYLFYCGRFEDAQRQLASLPQDLVESQRLFAERLEEEVETGMQLGLAESTWQEVRDDLAPRAYARAEQVLIDGGSPEDAVRWLSLALHKRHPEPWLQSLYLYCRAVEEDQAERAEEIKQHLLALDTPTPIKEALH